MCTNELNIVTSFLAINEIQVATINIATISYTIFLCIRCMSYENIMDNVPSPLTYAVQIARSLLNPLSSFNPKDAIDDIRRMQDLLTGIPYTFCVFLWRSSAAAKAVIDDIADIHSDPVSRKAIINSLLAAACWWDSIRMEYEHADDPTCANILIDAGADIRVGIAAATLSSLSIIRNTLKRRHKYEIKTEEANNTHTESNICTHSDTDSDYDSDSDSDSESESEILEAAQFLQKSNIALPHVRVSLRKGFTVIPPFAASIMEEASYDISLPGDEYSIPIGKIVVGSSGTPQFQSYTENDYSKKCCCCLRSGEGVFLTSCEDDGDGDTSLCKPVIKKNSPWQRNIFVFHDKLENQDILGKSCLCHRSCLLNIGYFSRSPIDRSSPTEFTC